jgi:hypothetical protein
MIHIVSFLYYIQEKVWEGSENNEEAWMQIFDVAQLRRQIVKRYDFFMVFTAFPGLSLDITEETYNIDPIVALYEKKIPFRCRVGDTIQGTNNHRGSSSTFLRYYEPFCCTIIAFRYTGDSPLQLIDILKISYLGT